MISLSETMRNPLLHFDRSVFVSGRGRTAARPTQGRTSLPKPVPFIPLSLLGMADVPSRRALASHPEFKSHPPFAAVSPALSAPAPAVATLPVKVLESEGIGDVVEEATGGATALHSHHAHMADPHPPQELDPSQPDFTSLQPSAPATVLGPAAAAVAEEAMGNAGDEQSDETTGNEAALLSHRTDLAHSQPAQVLAPYHADLASIAPSVPPTAPEPKPKPASLPAPPVAGATVSEKAQEDQGEVDQAMGEEAMGVETALGPYHAAIADEHMADQPSVLAPSPPDLAAPPTSIPAPLPLPAPPPTAAKRPRRSLSESGRGGDGDEVMGDETSDEDENAWARDEVETAVMAAAAAAAAGVHVLSSDAPLAAAQLSHPAAVQHQPAVALHQAAMAQHQPAVAQHQSAVAQHQPAVAQYQPAAAQQQPVAAQSEPAAAQSQPAPVAHTDDGMNIPCLLCGVRFRKPGHLNMHFRSLHASSAPPPAGGVMTQKRKVAGSDGLGVSKAGHAYGCPQCAARFRRGSDRNRHIRMVHEKRRPFQCARCPKSFGRNCFLQAHEATVHDKVRGFGCGECGAAFGQRSSLTRHARVIHNAVGKVESVGGGAGVGKLEVVHGESVGGEGVSAPVAAPAAVVDVAAVMLNAASAQATATAAVAAAKAAADTAAAAQVAAASAAVAEEAHHAAHHAAVKAAAEETARQESAARKEAVATAASLVAAQDAARRAADDVARLAAQHAQQVAEQVAAQAAAHTAAQVAAQHAAMQRAASIVTQKAGAIPSVAAGITTAPASAQCSFSLPEAPRPARHAFEAAPSPALSTSLFGQKATVQSAPAQILPTIAQAPESVQPQGEPSIPPSAPESLHRSSPLTQAPSPARSLLSQPGPHPSPPASSGSAQSAARAACELEVPAVFGAAEAEACATRSPPVSASDEMDSSPSVSVAAVTAAPVSEKTAMASAPTAGGATATFGSHVVGEGLNPSVVSSPPDLTRAAAVASATASAAPNSAAPIAEISVRAPGATSGNVAVSSGSLAISEGVEASAKLSHHLASTEVVVSHTASAAVGTSTPVTEFGFGSPDAADGDGAVVTPASLALGESSRSPTQAAVASFAPASAMELF